MLMFNLTYVQIGPYAQYVEDQRPKLVVGLNMYIRDEK